MFLPAKFHQNWQAVLAALSNNGLSRVKLSQSPITIAEQKVIDVSDNER